MSLACTVSPFIHKKILGTTKAQHDFVIARDDQSDIYIHHNSSRIHNNKLITNL